MSEPPLHFLIGHGSKSTEHKKAFEVLVQNFKSSYPQLKVEYGFLDYTEPKTETLLHEISKNECHIRILPIFLSKASHTQSDIPNLLNDLKTKYKDIQITLAEPLGEHPSLPIVIERELSVLMKLKEWHHDETDILILGRGSSIATSLNFITTLSESLKLKSLHTQACFWDIAEPSFKRALLSCKRKNLIVQPMFLFPGLLLDKVEKLLEQHYTKKEAQLYEVNDTLFQMPGFNEMLYQQALSSQPF